MPLLHFLATDDDLSAFRGQATHPRSDEESEGEERSETQKRERDDDNSGDGEGWHDVFHALMLPRAL